MAGSREVGAPDEVWYLSERTRRAPVVLQASKDDTLTVTTTQKLDALLARLKEERDGDTRRAMHYERCRHDFDCLSEMPLVHGIDPSRGLKAVVTAGGLLSQEARGMPAKDNSLTALGHRDKVFTSAGVPYPQKSAYFLFDAGVVDDATCEASPWDSGTFWKSRELKGAGPCGSPERREVYEAHRLPGRAARRYMVEYIASCWGTPPDYLEHRPAAHSDPLGAVFAGHCLLRIFEFRFRDRLPTSPSTLAAVVVPKRLGDGLTGILRRWKRDGVEIVYFDSARPHAGREAALRWIHKRMAVNP